MTTAMLSNTVIARKAPKAEKAKSNKAIVPLKTVKSNLVIGEDKGGEMGLMVTWSRLSKAEASVTNLKQYLTCMARDIAEYANTL